MNREILLDGMQLWAYDRVTPDVIAEGYYKVKEYELRLKGSRLSCTCLNGSLQGASYGDLCSHKYAVIAHEMGKELWRFNYGKKEEKVKL